MQRVLAIVAAVIAAAAVAYYVSRGQPSLDVASSPVEKLLASGRPVDARRELASTRSSLDAATADYLDGLIALAEGRDADAMEALARARGVRPTDWRIVSASAAAMANAGHFDDAAALLDAYVAAVPDDERGLAAVAQYRLDEGHTKPDPQMALAALDRIDALSSRRAPAGDPTAVSPSQLKRLRTKAYILAGKRQDAMLEARRATEETPNDPEAWYLLGEATRRLQKGPQSVDAYRRAARLAPTNRRYVEQLALALLLFDGDGKEILGIADALSAHWPADASLQLLRARALVRMENPKDPSTDHYTDDAAAVYRDLLKRDGVPAQVKQDARRNLAVLLYDWKQASRPGDYLEESWGLLQEWRRLGGEIDDALRPTWEDLEQRAKEGKLKR